MKTQGNLHLIISIITITILTSQSQASLISRKLHDKENTDNEENPQQKLLTDLESFFDSSLSPFNPAKSKDENQNLVYTLESKNASVNIFSEGSEVIVALQNGYESREIKLENIDINSENSFIEKKYMSDFIDHLNLIIDTPKKAYQGIADGISKSTYKGQTGASRFGTVTEANGNNRERILKLNNRSDEDLNPDSIIFQVEYVNENLKAVSDPIYGELSIIDGKFEVTLVTKFFQKTYQLAVSTYPYFVNESMNLGIKVLEHLDSLYNLNESQKESEEQGGGIKRFENSEYIDDGLDEKIYSFLGEGFEVAINGETVIVIHENSTAAQLDFEEEYVGNMVFKKISCKLEVLGGDLFHLVLPDKSIYNLKALIDKFVKEMMDHVKHAVNKFNPDEAA